MAHRACWAAGTEGKERVQRRGGRPSRGNVPGAALGTGTGSPNDPIHGSA